MQQKIEILSEPDLLGRVQHIRFWEDTSPPYCLTCGKAPERGCGCYENKTERGQMFFSKLEGSHEQ